MNIEHLHALEILDSRGYPTLYVEVMCDHQIIGYASVPAGASTGKKEAKELRDHDQKRYFGKGVQKAVHLIQHTLLPALKKQSIEHQATIDHLLCELDGTADKSKLGANTILAISLAVARARSTAYHLPLFKTLTPNAPTHMPIPLMNILNGGVHADNTLDIQEFMIVPVGAQNFAHALNMGAEVFHTLKQILKKRHFSTAVGDEGGFAPCLQNNNIALDLLSEAVIQAGYQLKTDIAFALDIAASELFDGQQYHLHSEQRILSSDDLIDYYQSLLKNYPIISIEDGLDESDWEGWIHLTKHLGHQIQLVGDDIFVTHTQLLQEGIQRHVANAILIKPNQVGTLTETLEAIQLAQQHHYQPIISHRSGETEDTFIADLAVATRCLQIKTGSLCRSERIAKYNQLLRIEEQTHLPYAVFSSTK